MNLPQFDRLHVALLTLLLTAAYPSEPQPAEKLDAAGLKTMTEGLGYTTKVLNSEAGKEKYEISLSEGGFNIPVSLEIAPSKRYIWLVANLGKAPTSGSPKFEALLKNNAKTQPVFTWITESGNLHMGMAAENRFITPAELRFSVTKVAADVAKSASIWQN